MHENLLGVPRIATHAQSDISLARGLHNDICMDEQVFWLFSNSPMIFANNINMERIRLQK